MPFLHPKRKDGIIMLTEKQLDIQEALTNAITDIQDEVNATYKEYTNARDAANREYQAYQEDVRTREQRVADRLSGLRVKLRVAEQEQAEANRAALVATAAGDDAGFEKARTAGEAATSKVRSLESLIEQMEEETLPRNEELFLRCKEAASVEADAYQTYNELCRSMRNFLDNSMKIIEDMREGYSATATWGVFNSMFDRVKSHYEAAAPVDAELQQRARQDAKDSEREVLVERQRQREEEYVKLEQQAEARKEAERIAFLKSNSASQM